MARSVPYSYLLNVSRNRRGVLHGSGDTLHNLHELHQVNGWRIRDKDNVLVLHVKMVREEVTFRFGEIDNVNRGNLLERKARNIHAGAFKEFPSRIAEKEYRRRIGAIRYEATCLGDTLGERQVFGIEAQPSAALNAGPADRNCPAHSRG